MALGLRYGSAFQHGGLLASFQELSGTGFNNPGIVFENSFSPYTHVSRLFVAPSRYSGVRKVQFWISVRHEQTAGQATYASRLRIAPQSTSATQRQIQTATILPSTIYKDFGSVQSIWTPDNDPLASAALYPWTGDGNELILRQYSGTTDAGCDILFIEFDRFEATSSTFFSDWDAVAANGDEDLYCGFRPVIERIDGGTWSALNTVNRVPTIVGFGFTVVQAPQTVNKTCIYVPASLGWQISYGMDTDPNTNKLPWHLPFRTADWDGDMKVHVLHRQSPNPGPVRPIGAYTVTAFTVQPGEGTGSEVTRFTESFTDTWTLETLVGRTADFRSSLVDGDNVSLKFNAIGATLRPYPRAHFEIILTSFNRCRVFFGTGTASAANPLNIGFRGGDPPPDRFGLDETVFDPLWFENLPESRILDAKMYGQLRHTTAANDAQLRVALNADLGANMNTSGLNALVVPSVSSTPNATIAYKMTFAEIEANNPINFAGKRKLKTLITNTPWSQSPGDNPGAMGLTYALLIPNREFLDLGPVFDLDAFAPEGCAATSAGLGDNPGLLIITNGSTLPQKFNPQAAGTPGEIEDAGIPTPFEGETPQAVPDVNVCSPDGGLGAGTYIYRYTFRNCCTDKESDPNPEDIVVPTLGASPCAKVDFSFANVRIPGDPQICEICLYRTLLDGAFPVMAKVGCFDPSVTSLFTDDVSDEALDFENEALSILNAPMPCVPIVVEFRNRLFGMGDIPNLAPGGTVSVVNGSDIVTGSAEVEWTRCLEGKLLRVEGDCRAYEILRVLPPEIGVSPALGRLRLTEVYEGDTASLLGYEICGRPNRLYCSEPFEPEYWPAANFIDIEPGDGDRLMGAVSNFDSLVICKRRKTYILRFNENPVIEVFMPTRISSDIGCIGPRTFAQVESGSVWLGDRGIVIFDGRTVQHLPASDVMNDMFTDPENPRYVRRDRNGRVIDAVGAFYPTREQYLLLVPTVRSTRGCDVMVVWDVKLNNITILEFCQQFQSMVVAKDAEGNERVYIGDTDGFVWIFDIGDTDGVGVPNATGTVRGTVTDAGTEDVAGASFLDDSTAVFLEGGLPGAGTLSGVPGLSGAFSAFGGELGLAGVCVYTRAADAAYDDPWTVRKVFAATATRLYVTPAWDAERPAVGDDYMLGAINFDCLFKPQNYGTDDMVKRDWRQIIVHEIEQFASRVRVDLLPDFQLSDPEADTVVTDGETGEGRVFLMDHPKGRQVRPVGRLIHSFMSVRIRNFAPEEPVRIINHLLGVMAQDSK